jgi:hypothetical protein
MREGILDQSRLRKLVSEMETICKRNGWPVVALAIIGNEQKKGVGLVRLNPNDDDQMEAVREYPLVGNTLMGAAIVYANYAAKELSER